MDITLDKLLMTDAEALLTFERENRAYFEKMVPTRGDDYYNIASFIERHKALLDEQAKEESYFYLIKDKKGSILGRINLIDIEKSKGIGDLGYRVGQVHTGKGIANHALKILLEKIVNEGRITQINAKTTTNNVASQKILEKNGFERRSIANDEAFEIDGQEFKFVYYVWTN